MAAKGAQNDAAMRKLEEYIEKYAVYGHLSCVNVTLMSMNSFKKNTLLRTVLRR